MDGNLKGLTFDPLCELGLFWQFLSFFGNRPCSKVMLTIFKSDGATMSTEVFRILALRPSRPVALVTSNAFIVEMRSESFMKGIQKLNSLGTLVFI